MAVVGRLTRRTVSHQRKRDSRGSQATQSLNSANRAGRSGEGSDILKFAGTNESIRTYSLCRSNYTVSSIELFLINALQKFILLGLSSREVPSHPSQRPGRV